MDKETQLIRPEEGSGKAFLSRRGQLAYLAVLGVLTSAYLLWRIFFTLPKGHGVLSLVCAVILLVTELFGAAEMFIHLSAAVTPKEGSLFTLPRLTSLSGLPDVDVLVPCFGEGETLLRRTLSACRAIAYEEGKVHIFLCDDGRDPAMAALAEELGAGYLTRPDNKDAKAGNLNAALAATSSPLVAVFDADMCPHYDFLIRTVPYFLDTKSKNGRRQLSAKKGFLQTPQSFRNQDLFQKVFGKRRPLSNEQDYFYRCIEPSLTKGNAVIFGGSNALLARSALAAAGGFATGTLTEDFATGIELEKSGFLGAAVATPLADGLVPETLSSLIRQRTRWARGCIRSAKTTRFALSKKLSAFQKLHYAIAVSYWYFPVKRLIYLLSPLLFALFGIAVMRCSFYEMLLLWLPMYLLSAVGIRLFSGGVRTARWSRFYELCLSPFLLFPSLAETLGFRARTFHVTAKRDTEGAAVPFGTRLLQLLPFALFAAASALGIFRTVLLILDLRSPDYLFLLFWLIFNFLELLRACFFVLRAGKA